MTAPFALEDMFPETMTPVPAGETPSWFTPLGEFLRWEESLLHAGVITTQFNLDPCAHYESPVTREILGRGGIAYTAEHNGLRQPWRGASPFINAPFDAETMAAFLARLKGLLEDGGVHEAGVHCPAWTDRGWWQDYVETDRRAGRCEVRFGRGRLTYGYPGNPTGRGGETAKFPSAWIVWSPTLDGKEGPG